MEQDLTKVEQALKLNHVATVNEQASAIYKSLTKLDEQFSLGTPYVKSRQGSNMTYDGKSNITSRQVIANANGNYGYKLHVKLGTPSSYTYNAGGYSYQPCVWLAESSGFGNVPFMETLVCLRDYSQWRDYWLHVDQLSFVLAHGTPRALQNFTVTAPIINGDNSVEFDIVTVDPTVQGKMPSSNSYMNRIIAHNTKTNKAYIMLLAGASCSVTLTASIWNSATNNWDLCESLPNVFDTSTTVQGDGDYYKKVNWSTDPSYLYPDVPINRNANCSFTYATVINIWWLGFYASGSLPQVGGAPSIQYPSWAGPDWGWLNS